MRQNFFLALIAVTMIPAFTFTQCKNPPKRELMMLDTLDTVLVRTRENMHYDLRTLDNRKKRILEDQNLIAQFYSDTMDYELGQKMTKYKGIYKIYDQFIKNYQQVHNELVRSEKQLADLRNSVEDHKLTREEFKKYYQEEKEIAMENYKLSRDMSVNVPEVEPDFQRISREVSEILNAISAKMIRNENDSTLYRVLESRE